jgi:hypothetical protein
MKPARLTRVTRHGHTFMFVVNPYEPWTLLYQCLNYQHRPELQWSPWDTKCVLRLAALSRLYGITKMSDCTPEPREDATFLKKVWDWLVGTEEEATGHFIQE